MFAVRVFLAPDNWLGFGAADFIVLAAAAVLLVAARFLRFPVPRVDLPNRPARMALMLAAGTVALRVILLFRYPVPVASGADDFGYWLLADTLHHLRLANPAHDFPAFFEQLFVLQEPTYSSMFNLGQGIVMALGWTFFGHPWAGVLLSSAALPVCCYWALRGWTTPGWAAAGGWIATMQFGPLSYWTNSYWGGSVSACAGCLVFGALPRWNRRQDWRGALPLGLGLGLQVLTRPFEFLLLAMAVAIAMPWMRQRVRLLLRAMPVLALAGCLMGLQNKAVTGRWTVTPYLAYRAQYGAPATFTFEKNAVPHKTLNQEQQLDYEAEAAIHGSAGESLPAYGERLLFRLRFYRFFLLPPLYLAVLVFVCGIRGYRELSLLLSLAIFMAGSNFYPYFYPHYIAAAAPLLLLMAVEGLRKVNRWRPGAGGALLCLCGAQFLFWYVVRLSSYEALAQYESWDFINWGDREGRIAIEKTLDRTPGKLLVFVHYGPDHRFSEWVHNASDIDASRVIWAHDLGDTENGRLRRRYPDRAAMICEPDATPPQVHAYAVQSGPFEEVR